MKTIRKRIILFVVLTVLVSAVALPAANAQDQEIEECASPSWVGSFYNTSDLTGPTIHVLCRRLLDFAWGGGTPFRGVNNENFSMSWSSTQSFATAGTYRFTATVIGGARVFIDGQLIIDDMTDVRQMRELEADFVIDTASKPYNMRVEYAAYPGEAHLRLDWSLVAGADPLIIQDHSVTDANLMEEFKAGGGNVWWIEHFMSTTPGGTPAGYAIHVADGISYDYKLDPPRAGFPGDGWSSRWYRVVDFPAGTYTFTFRAQDGGLVTIDGQPLDNVTSIPGGFTGTKTLNGRHMIVVEHYDFSGEESIFFTWDPPYGTMLRPDGCNAVYTAGVNNNAPLCPGNTIPTVNP